jgi:endo-beta-N-acetylglucosaminidase D
MLILFLYKLKNSLKKRIGKQSQLVWYDSVCIDGSLKWQDELNSKNV